MHLTPGRTLSVALLFGLAACGGGDDKSATATATATATASTEAPATPAPAGQNWNAVYAATPEGGFRIGNPDAKVKLLEFASLTCPHCSEFHESAMETIRSKYVASGNVSYEFRNFVLNGPDFAASMLARCQGPEAFFGLLGSFFADQQSWTQPFTKLTDADQKALNALPQDQQIARLAQLGQLDAYVRTRGIPKAKFDQCVADKSQLDRLTALRNEATEKYKLTGTPGFIINGTTQEGVFTWTDLEPRLQEALR